MTRLKEKIARIIASKIACEQDCKDIPSGCGCSLEAADAVLADLGILAIIPPIPIQFAPARGETLEEMRANVFVDGLGQIGDAMLIWVNEGDFLHLQMNGGASAVTSQTRGTEA